MTQRSSLESLDVTDAPELSTLCGLDVLLDLTITALVAAHPQLQSGAAIQGTSPSLWLAESLVDEATTLRVSLGRYKAAIRAEAEQEIPW